MAQSQCGSYFSPEVKSDYNHNRPDKKFYEVFFRHVFTSTHPYEEIDSHSFKCSLRIDIKKLCHITHDKEAKEINKEEKFVFQPKQKRGKRYRHENDKPLRNGDPLGESFVDSFLQPGMGEFQIDPSKQRYHYIKYPASLMPEGYYSWWGIHISAEQAKTATHKALLNARESGKCPAYLQNPPASCYGNREFSGDLHHLLVSYQSIHKPKPNHSESAKHKLPEVYLLLGGTLRYRYEICYVVIVCTEEHRHSEALKDYQPVPHMQYDPNYNHPILDLRGLTDESGKVVDYSGCTEPRFYPWFINAYSKKKQSWGNLAFAFYFDSDNTLFELENLECNEVHHDRDLCVTTRPKEEKPQRGEIWYCPNEPEV